MHQYLTQALHRAIRARGQHIATICGDRRQTYADFADRVMRLASALRQLGLQPGDRVGMLSLNSDHYLEYYFAVWWAGGVVNPVNIRWSVPEIAYSLDDCDTRILIVDAHFATRCAALREQSQRLQTLIGTGELASVDGLLSYETLIAQSEPVADAGRHDDDLAGIFYTGGTTGKPKGVMLSHLNLLSNAVSALAELPLPADSRVLHAAPLFHLAALSLMLRGFVRGASHVVLPAFDPLALMQLIARERASSVLMVPTMIQLLVEHPQLAAHDLSSLKQLLYGASPISEAVLDRAMQALPGVEFAQGYGMTELSAGVSFLEPVWHDSRHRVAQRLRSAGQPINGVDVRIVDEQNREQPAGRIGEVIVRSPGLMLGYWNRPVETAQAIRDGWMHTGDAGYLDDEGFLFIVDRIKDMIISGGENVYSAEVENVLAQHPAVASCAVIGVPDAKWGEAVHAVIVLRAECSATPDELRAFCQSRIAGYKCPRSFDFRAALPYSAAGKLLKYQLREEHRAQQR